MLGYTGGQKCLKQFKLMGETVNLPTPPKKTFTIDPWSCQEIQQFMWEDHGGAHGCRPVSTRAIQIFDGHIHHVQVLRCKAWKLWSPGFPPKQPLWNLGN